jgi:4-hydroxyphenylpyruvate dioxygenase
MKQNKMDLPIKKHEKTFGKAKDFLPLIGTDFIELYVGNALQAAYYYKAAFGFQSLAYAGLSTGNRDTESYVVVQDKINLVLTSPLKSKTKIGQHIDRHGDGIKVIALTVEDAVEAYTLAMEKGAVSYLAPLIKKDEYGVVVQSGIYTYGDTVHLFIERKDYSGIFLPGFIAWETPEFAPHEIGLQYIDHMVGNVQLGRMNTWVKFYEEVMGFTNIISFDDKDISPAKGLKRSQVDEYLDFYEGEGVQHIAVSTQDILNTVKQLRKRGVRFLEVPASYYEDLINRIGPIEEDLEQLQALGILVDRDEEGYLLQIFTQPVQPRPTLFFEIIQRKGARSFGKGNFKALFEAIEREQAIRGTL